MEPCSIVEVQLLSNSQMSLKHGETTQTKLRKADADKNAIQNYVAKRVCNIIEVKEEDDHNRKAQNLPCHALFRKGGKTTKCCV